MCTHHLSLDSTPTLSAREIHDVLTLAHKAGNTARKRFIDALRALQDSRLHFELGFPSSVAYADATFHLSRTQTLESIRVSRALLELPRLSEAFEHGRISWSLALAITRVATAETEGEWLELLEKKPVRAVQAELEDARRKNRRSPRKDGYGLPGLTVKFALDLTPEEHALFERGIAKVEAEVSGSLGGEALGPKESLLYLLRRILETEPEVSVTQGREETGLSPFTVVVHKCESCARATVDTDEGRVELEAEALERIEREIDRPNTPALRRAVCLREGGRCANPHCRRLVGKSGHAHHVEFRSDGGRTELSNECFTCVVCHALIHARHLVVEGDPERGLVWRPRAMGWKSSAEEDLDAAREVPVVRPAEVDPAPPSRDRDTIELAEAGLVKLGWPKKEAERRVEAAWRLCAGRAEGKETIDPGDLLREAIRLQCA